ncbi:MAG TPA: hypothetical protein VEP93_12100, partial [Variovorax sp.]|nr:hypothetical protein [Variovorax sp.]
MLQHERAWPMPEGLYDPLPVRAASWWPRLYQFIVCPFIGALAERRSAGSSRPCSCPRAGGLEVSSLLPRIPPSVEIRLLIHEMNFHLVCDEALYVSRLRSHGIDEMRALDAYRFTQIALGRRLKVLQGVPLPDTFVRFDTAGRCIDSGRLSQQTLFR